MKKICVITTSHADYGRVKPVMRAIKNHPHFELQVVVGTSLFLDHLWWYLRHGEPLSWWKSLPWHLRARTKVLFRSSEFSQLETLTRILVEDGFPIHARLPLFLEGGNLRTMVKTAGLGILGITDVFEKLRPDILLLHGDRFEILSLAMAAAFFNIPIAHIEGGDVSGTIDNSVRHAVSKLAHVHFAVTAQSGGRLIRMGEDPRRVFVTGSPIIDFLKTLDLSLDNSIYQRYKGSSYIDLTQPFIFVVYHPVTTEYDSNYSKASELIAALDELRMPTFCLVPNIDAGSNGIAEALREYYIEHKPSFMALRKRFTPEDFAKILAHATVAVGNSSSFIREAAYLGTPVVLLGTRQGGRERGRNLVEVKELKDEIIRAIKLQMEHGRYEKDMRFGDGNASQKIVEVLVDLDLIKLDLQKGFYE